MTIMITSLLNRFKKNIFLRDDAGRCVDYRDVMDLAYTQEFKATKRTLVFCIVNNSIGGIAGYVALLTANAVPMMVSEGLSSRALHDLIAAYIPEYIWLPERDSMNLINATVQVRYNGYALICLNNRANATAPLHGDLALLLSTSGSLGSCKYVRLSHQNLWSNAAAIANYLSLTVNDIPITTLPLSYSYGLSIVHSHMWVGASLAVSNKTFFDRDFWNFLRDVKATSIAGVPYHYEILKKLRFARMDLPHLCTLTQAGGFMSPDLTKEFAAHCQIKNMRFFTMYGQTEASPRMSYVPAEKAYLKAGTIGIPIPGGSFQLESEVGAVLTETNVVGELVYRGPNVSLGYAECRTDLSLGDINCGILHTGDLAERDDDGYYKIVGRQKRFIKLFGNRVNLQDVELQLYGYGAEVACSGCDDMLEIYLVASSLALALEIKQAVMSSLRVASQGVMVYEVDALPRNESGKVRYADLQSEKARRLA